MTTLSAGQPWPSVTYEKHPWHISDAVRANASRTAIARATGPYRAAITPAIAQADLVVSPEVAARADEAARAITRFDVRIAETFGSVEIAPMSAILLRTESASSSQIENLTVGARQIAMAELGEKASPNASLVVGNVQTMKAALDLSSDFTIETILELQRTLMSAAMPEHAGRLRDQQVWIGRGDIGPHSASFVPPHHSRVTDALDDLAAFASRTDLPVLPQIAVAHAQFETIHPFIDGNGRTGRALVHSMMRSRGLSERATVPLSAGLLTDTRSYFDALTRYREGDPEPIIDEFSRAADFAVAAGSQLVERLAATRDALHARTTARAGSTARRCIDLFVGQPVVNARYVAGALDVSVKSAERAIERLAADGIVTLTGKNTQRLRVWACTSVLDDLEEFAALVRRSSVS